MLLKKVLQRLTMINNSRFILTIPNVLSFFRVILTFVILALLNNYLYRWAFLCFLMASLTDVLDGFMARRLNQETRFGAWIDSVADNVFNIALIFYFYTQREVPGYYLIILVVRNALQLFYAMLRIGALSKWNIQRNKLDRWEPGMVFFVLLFLFIKMNLSSDAGPIHTGIEQVILPYVFMPLSALSNLIVLIRFLVSRQSEQRVDKE